jgi:hypothetical protein
MRYGENFHNATPIGRYGLYDAPQQALGFLISQTTFIEQEVYRIQYPDIMYPRLVPVDSSASEWAKSITYYSLDKVGNADWFDGYAHNMPLADVNRQKYEQSIEMAGIGYRYTTEELGVQMMIPGTNLSTERAEAARRAYQEFVDRICRVGDPRKSIFGLINSPIVQKLTAPATGTGSSPLWINKTADQMITDVQTSLTQVYQGSLTVEMADTVLLPIAQLQILANTRIPNTYGNALDYLRKYNLYTFTTGQELTILGILNLDTAGSGGTARMITYRRDPSIVKLHIPMQHRFLPVWQTGPMVFDIPGIFRIGSVEIRRPGAFCYTDGI